MVGVAWPMETFLERLLTGLQSTGAEITIMSAAKPEDDWLRRHDIKWQFGPRVLTARQVVSQTRRNGPRAAATAVRQELSHRLRPAHSRTRDDRYTAHDVVYAPWINTVTQVPSIINAKVPVVVSCRGRQVSIVPWAPGRGDHRRRLSEVLRGATLVHCVSEAIAADAVELGLRPDRARIIRPAVDPAHYSPRPPGNPDEGPLRLVMVGSISWVKDHETALVAVRKALDRGVDIRLDVVGQGPALDQVRYVIDDLNLQERVHLLGKRTPDQVATHLSESDVFVHSSSSEGISNAVLEAMASGLAVVCTDCGGMAEAIRDGVDGLLVPVRGTNDMADALVTLAGDPQLRARLGASARQRVERGFRLDQQIADFHALLCEAASR